MRILITGARGQLGRELPAALAEHQVLPLGRLELDVTQREMVRRAVGDFQPAVVIHTAAYTEVDGCERDPETAYRVNALGTQNVALACQEAKASMVYLSTDFVFDGKKSSPYLEYDQPNPLGVYGKSKLAGEYYTQALLDRFYIVRTAWLYGAGGRHFVESILRLAESREELLGVTDQVGSPTWTRDLAQALAQLIQQPVYGIYHLTNEGGCSRYEFVQKILQLAGRSEVRVLPTTAQEYHRHYPSPTVRPAYAVLRNFCAANALGITLPPWEEALQEFLCSYR